MTSFVLPHEVRRDGTHGVPALAVAGALDPAPSPDVMGQTWLALYPRAEPAVLPGAGHNAMDESPLDLIRTVEDFLRADAVDGTDGTAGTDAAVQPGEARAVDGSEPA